MKCTVPVTVSHCLDLGKTILKKNKNFILPTRAVIGNFIRPSDFVLVDVSGINFFPVNFHCDRASSTDLTWITGTHIWLSSLSGSLSAASSPGSQARMLYFWVISGDHPHIFKLKNPWSKYVVVIKACTTIVVGPCCPGKCRMTHQHCKGK